MSDRWVPLQRREYHLEHRKNSSEVDRRSSQHLVEDTGVLAVKVETVMGGSSPTFGPGIGIIVEKPDGGDYFLPFVMPEN
ncbi:hypothetical protein Tco_0445662 [Tanacetum coccineum]